MTTSGSVDFSINRDNLITDALMLVGAIGPDDTPTSNQTTHAARMLNMMVKSLEGKLGIGLWARKTGYILPQSMTTPTSVPNGILLGSTGDHATNNFTQTTLSSNASSGASTIVVTAATGFADTYYVGVELDGGDMQWTTVSGVPVGTTVTLATTLTDDASAGNYVYVYQTKMTRPLHVVGAYRRDMTSSSDIPLIVESKADFDTLGSKASEGVPNQLAYDPQLDNGVLYFYPRFTDGKSIIVISYQRPFEDFDATNDTPDFPPNYYLALCYKLAVILAPTYGLPVQDRGMLLKEAELAMAEADALEPEDGSYMMQPGYRYD